MGARKHSRTSPMGPESRSGRTARALGPDDRGRRLFERLIFPRAAAAYGPAAGPWPDDPTELVHDTRVACRRLVEALELVGPGLPSEVTSKLRKDAKKLRRALGARREADVMKADFESLVQRTKLPEGTGSVVTDMMLSHGASELRRARESYSPKRLGAIGGRVEGAAAVFDRTMSLRQLAGPHLYDRACQPEGKLGALADPTAPDAHHALRIDFKRLRYTLEILAPVFPDAFESDDLIGTLKEVQDALGTLQDAGDLLRFLELEPLRAHVDETSLDILRDYALEEREERRAGAERVVGVLAPDVLGECRRAAGKIGQLELIST